jgi:hypothetical protein
MASTIAYTKRSTARHVYDPKPPALVRRLAEADLVPGVALELPQRLGNGPGLGEHFVDLFKILVYYHTSTPQAPVAWTSCTTGDRA